MSVCENCGHEQEIVLDWREDDAQDRLDEILDGIEHLTYYRILPGKMYPSAEGSWAARKDIERLRDAALEG
jgi:hypothetical protein